MATEKVTYELTLRDLMTKGLADINKNLSAMENKLNKVQNTANKTGSSMGSTFSSLKAGFAALGVGALATEIFQTSSKLEGLSLAIKATSIDSVDANKNLQFLNDLTKKMPIDLEAAYEGFKTFNGGLMGTALHGEKGRKVFEQVATGAAGMQLTAEQTKGAFLALGQMMSKGTVQAEELRGQLGERIPGAFGMMAEALGVTTKQLGEMMQKGEVLAVDAVPKFAAVMEKRFKKSLDGANDSINSSVVRLGNLKNQIALGAIPAFGQMSRAVADFAVSLYDNFEPIKEMFGFMFDLGKNFLMSISAPFIEIFSIFGGAADGINWMSFALKTLATTTMIALLPLRVLLNTVTLIYDTFTLLIQSAKNAASAIKGVFTGDWDKVNEAWQNQKESISTFGTKQMDKFVKPFQEIKDIWTDSKGALSDSQTSSGTTNSLSTMAGVGGGGGSDKLKNELDSIKGKAPSNTYINIEALIKGDINNMISGVQNAEKDMNTMLEKLEAALLTVVNDVNKIQN
jgi:tape measure domain-containing protein